MDIAPDESVKRSRTRRIRATNKSTALDHARGPSSRHSAAAASASAHASAIVGVHARARTAGEESSTRTCGGVGTGGAGAGGDVEPGGGGRRERRRDRRVRLEGGEKRRVHARDRRELLDRVRLRRGRGDALRREGGDERGVVHVLRVHRHLDVVRRSREAPTPGRDDGRVARAERGVELHLRERGLARGCCADGVERERELLHLDPRDGGGGEDARLPRLRGRDAGEHRVARRLRRGRRRRERGRGRGRRE